MNLISSLEAITKNVLNDEDLHYIQIKVILKEAIDEAKENISNDQYIRLMEIVERFSVSNNTQDILIKAIQNVSPIKVNHAGTLV